MDADVLLIKKILDGNTSYYSEIVTRYYSKVFTFIYKMHVTREDAEDIAQEVFVKVYNNLYKYNSNWSFTTWIYKVALNTYKDFRKHNKIKTEEIDENYASGSENSPEAHINSIYQQQMINKMFESLNDDVKAIMILHYYHGLNFKEIGEIVKLSPEAVKMKIYRARKHLCKKYGKNVIGGEYYEM